MSRAKAIPTPPELMDRPQTFILDIRTDTTLIAAAFRELGCGVRNDLVRMGVLHITPALYKDLVHLA